MRLPSSLAVRPVLATLCLSACSADLSTSPEGGHSAAGVVGTAPSYLLTDVEGTGAAVGLITRLNTGKCMDVAGGGVTAGTRVVVWDCSFASNQSFTWTAAKELRYASACLTADGTGAPGSWLFVAPCTGAATQRWTSTAAGAITSANGLCIDVPYANASNDQQLIVWNCTGSTNQQWNERVLVAAPPAQAAPPPAQTGAWSNAPTSPITWSYQTFAVPSGAIAIAPGDNWQRKVDAAAIGATFVVRAGTHHSVTVSPKDGQLFIGERGAILDGDGVTLAAFDTRYRPSKNVVVRGLTFQNYATTNVVGAVQGDNATNWTVEGNEIRTNAGTGMRVGPGMQVRNNFVHHNGYAGIAGWRANGALIERNEVSYNNTSGSLPDNPTGGAAGLKFTASDNLTFRSNFSHHNTGVGMWCDEGCYLPTYEYNTVSDNYYRGIFVELSYNAVVRYNTTERNQTTYSDGWPAGGGIVVSAASGVEVYGNAVRDNGDGIFGFQAENRGSGAHGPYELTNFYVHDNLIRQPHGMTGVGQLVSDATYWSGRNNRFAANSYVLTGNARPFIWVGNASKTEVDWRAYGQDTTGSFSR